MTRLEPSLLKAARLAATVAIAFAAPTAASAQTTPRTLLEDVCAYRVANESAIVSDPMHFLAMPNVATNIEDIEASAR